MTKNRIVTVFDRYPEQTAQLKKLGDLFGKAGRIQLAQVNVSEIDRIQIDRGLDFIGDIDGRIKQSEATIRAMTKANANVKLLKTIPGVGEFFARLIDAEIDDIDRFRSPKKLAAYAGLVPSTYSSGGKTYHGKIIKQGNKWLRWAFVEAVAPAVASDPQLRAQYEHLKLRGTNKARVAVQLFDVIHTLDRPRLAQPPLGHEALKARLPRREAVVGGDPVQRHEADVVPVARIAGAGIAEADDQAHCANRSRQVFASERRGRPRKRRCPGLMAGAPAGMG